MAIHEYVLHNGEIRRACEPMLTPGQIGLLSGWGVFSTLRVMQGVAFAWERHWARMTRDARLINVAMPFDPAAVERDLMKLADANGCPDCTTRVVAVRNSGGFWAGPSRGAETDLIALTADLHDWGESVRLGVQPNGRYAANEFSGAKILAWAQNLTWAERAHAAGLDEVVLLNEHGFLAECTSANIFAAFGSELVTPPLSDGCLPGVTREILLETGRVGRFSIAERRLRVEDLYASDGVFITSSTRNLLPVAELCGRPLKMDHEAAGLLSNYFENYIRSYTSERLRVLSRE